MLEESKRIAILGWIYEGHKGIVDSQKFHFTEKLESYLDIPPHPWHTLRSDLFYSKKMDFLVDVDYFS